MLLRSPETAAEEIRGPWLTAPPWTLADRYTGATPARLIEMLADGMVLVRIE